MTSIARGRFGEPPLAACAEDSESIREQASALYNDAGIVAAAVTGGGNESESAIFENPLSSAQKADERQTETADRPVR